MNVVYNVIKQTLRPVGKFSAPCRAEIPELPTSVGYYSGSEKKPALGSETLKQVMRVRAASLEEGSCTYPKHR